MFNNLLTNKSGFNSVQKQIISLQFNNYPKHCYYIRGMSKSNAFIFIKTTIYREHNNTVG